MTTAHLYYFPLADLPDDFQETDLIGVLDERELARFHDTKSKNVRQQFVLSRWIVKHGLSRMTGKPAAEHHFSYEESGKPFVDLPTPVHFSIAHCPTSVAVVVSDVAVGVDVENNKRKGEPWDQLGRFFYPELNERMQAHPQYRHRDFFYMHWTGMESFVKMMGSKVAIERRTFAKHFEIPLEAEYVNGSNAHFYFQLVDKHEHLTVASEQALNELRCERVILHSEGVKTAPI